MVFDVCTFPVEVDLALFAYDGPAWEVAPFRYRSGWLAFGRARAETAFGDREAILVAAVAITGRPTQQGLQLAFSNCRRLFLVRLTTLRPKSVEEALDNAYWDFFGAVDLDCRRLLGEAQDALDERIRVYEGWNPPGLNWRFGRQSGHCDKSGACLPPKRQRVGTSTCKSRV